MSLIKIKNLTKQYNGKVVLGPINLDIEKGSSVAIFGANGAGKTTLCEIISNTKSASSGHIDYEFAKDQIPYVLGINFQDQVYPTFIKVKELLAFYQSLYQKKVSSQDFEIMVNKFQLQELFNRKVNSLSGGQRQRVNLFISLFHKPQVYVGDEITTGLDIKTRIDVIDFLKEQLNNNHITLLLVSHNLDEIQQLCERIIFLQDGKIIDDTTVAAVTKKFGSLLDYYLEKTGNKSENRREKS